MGIVRRSKESYRDAPKSEAELIEQLATLRDRVAELEEVEEALREPQQNWQSLIENAPHIIMIVGPDGIIQYINHTVSGITPREAVGRTVYEYVPADYHDTIRETLERVFESGGCVSYQIQGTGPNGTTSWYETHVGPIKHGDKVVALSLICTDITWRKKTEDALRESELKYMTLLENLPQKIFLKDRNSVYISCNKNYAKDLKIRPEEIAGKTDFDFYPVELADKYRADDRLIMESGQIKDIKEKYIKDGREVVVHTVKTPVKDQHNNIIGVLGIFWDITEGKRREKELNVYRQKMARAEQLVSLGVLSATMTHELTQPLTFIRLSIENALAEMEKKSWPVTIKKNLRDSLDEVSNVTSILERFRTFARKSSERVVRQVNLQAIAERTVELLSEAARLARVSLHLRGLKKLPAIYANEKNLEQLFFALVENAIQAADGNKQHQVLISGSAKKEQIRLRFTDNCGGIAPENFDRIFESFFTTKPIGEGTGLGLCIVQSIVYRAGGEVRVESKTGKGSTFIVILPIKAGNGS